MMAATDPSKWTLPRIAIDREGVWFHEGEEVTHAGMLVNLQNDLRRDAQGHYLQVGIVRVPVDVEDTPFVIVRVERDGDRLTTILNDLSREPLDTETLRFAENGTPYSSVKGGMFEARWNRAATYQLLQHVEPDASGERGTLVLGDRRYAVPGLGGQGEPERRPPSGAN
jgi:hypothetical protein